MESKFTKPVVTLSVVMLLAPRPSVGQDAEAPRFIRGDADGSGSLNVLDVIAVLGSLFADRSALPCEDAADSDDSGDLELLDGVYLANSLFLRGPAPALPFPNCGVDATFDELGCAEYECPLEFAGVPLEGDGFYFVIDRSGSSQNAGQLGIAKQEVNQTIDALHPNAEFGIVFVDRNVLKFPSSGIPAVANEELRATATEWVASTGGGSGSCIQQGLLAALEFADRARSERNTVIYVGDGGGTCMGANEATYLEQTLEIVDERNVRDVTIHAIAVFEISRSHEEFLRELAARNSGIYHQITR